MSNTPSLDTAIRVISKRLAENGCVLFLGDEINFSQLEITKGKKQIGLPTRTLMLNSLRQNPLYAGLNEAMPFSHALSLIRNLEGGYDAVLRFLREHLLKPTDVPPVYYEVAQLPFRAVITTNWDSLLEKAVEKSSIMHQVLYGDEDIQTETINTLPIIKLWGSLERGKVRSNIDELQDLFIEHPLLTCLLKVICARRILVFLGFRLDDADFINLFRVIKRVLGEQSQSLYVIHNSSNTLDISYWASENTQVIKADSTVFLRRLRTQIDTDSVLTEGSITEASFWERDRDFGLLLGYLVQLCVNLFRIPSGGVPLTNSERTCAKLYLDSRFTESEVVARVLTFILNKLDTPEPFDNIRPNAYSAINHLLQLRPNYQGLRTLLRPFAPNDSGDEESRQRTREEIKSHIQELIQEKEKVKHSIGEVGQQLIRPEDKILIYIRSTRVLAAINTWLHKNKSRQNDLELIVPEGRPKHPNPFQNALETIDAIESTEVRIRLIPDAAIGYFMETRQITKVFFGAHTIYRSSDGNLIITNVVGTQMITKLATAYNIPVYIFAEEAKIQHNDLGEPLYRPTETVFREEVPLISGKTNALYACV